MCLFYCYCCCWLSLFFLSEPATCAEGRWFECSCLTQKSLVLYEAFLWDWLTPIKLLSEDPLVTLLVSPWRYHLMDTNVSSCNDVTFSSDLSIALQWGNLQSTWSHQCQSLNCPGTHKFFYVTAHIASIWSRKRFRFPSRRRLAHHVCTRFHYQSEIGRIVNLLLVFRSNCQRTTFKLLVMCNK